MGETGTNILNLSKSAFNLLKKSDFVQRILDLKGKVVVDVDLHKLGGKDWKKHELNCGGE